MLQSGEILIILLLALVLLGPKRLPEIARRLGTWFAEFRTAARSITETIESEVAETERLVRGGGSPVDDVTFETTVSNRDPTRYEWTGPKPESGPTPDDALTDLERIEGRWEATNGPTVADPDPESEPDPALEPGEGESDR